MSGPRRRAPSVRAPAPRCASEARASARGLVRKRLAAAALSGDERAHLRDRAEVLRHELGLGDVDAEFGLDELDDLHDPHRVDDAGLDERQVVPERVRRAQEELVDDVRPDRPCDRLVLHYVSSCILGAKYRNVAELWCAAPRGRAEEAATYATVIGFARARTAANSGLRRVPVITIVNF